MAILARNVPLPVFLCVEEGAARRLSALLHENNLHFHRHLVVTGAPPVNAIAGRVAERLSGPHETVTVTASTAEEAECIKRAVERFGADVIIGVGGGTVLDTAKFAASEKGVPFISVPTAVSNDGIASPVSVIRINGAARSLNTHMPAAVVADLAIIRQSPPATIRAGVGDLASNLSACADWRLAYKKDKEPLDEFTETISRNAAVRIIEAESPGLTDPAFLRTLIEGLIMSGIAMGIHGSSRPSSGAEHMISHAIDHLFKQGSRHGEQAGLATLFTLCLHKISVVPLRRLFAALSMPQVPADIALTKKEFLAAVRTAPTMRPGRYSILNQSRKAQIEAAYALAYEQD
ncbi:MAG: iron-containing alcohol dehydrogenase family protein [Fibrobacterota bacterium]